MLKLWLLRPVEGLIQDNPWEPWYDKCFGFVARAETESEARRFAQDNAGDETHDQNYADTRMPWLDAAYSTCVELIAEGAVGIIIRDFAAA